MALVTRQVFLGTPWVHRRAPGRIVQFFNREGSWLRLPAGAGIFNGGDTGEIALVLSGLGAFSFQDQREKNHIFALILPERLMGDVDGVSGETVNVIDTALRETEVRMLRRERFLSFLAENPDIQLEHTIGVISDHESDMEGMIANYTLEIDERVLALFSSLLLQAGVAWDGTWAEVPYGLSVVEISKVVSSTRATVSAVLSKWRLRGLIRKEGRRILVSRGLLGLCSDWSSSGSAPGLPLRRRRGKA